MIHSEFQLLLPVLACISPIFSDEHYRRSSDCSFFTFAAAPAKKATRQSRANKPRASKTSRVSTQSNATTVSEAGTFDLDDAMDQSAISQATTKSKTTRKTTKSKAKVGRPKREESAEPVGQMDIEDNHDDSDEKPRSKRPGRGQKRTSDEMDGDEQLQNEDVSYVKPERPTKKRTTKARNTAAQASIDSDADADVDTGSLETTLPEDSMAKEGPSKPRGGKKKQSSLSTRKPSADLSASKASLRSRIPDDAEIEAELEAGLEDAMSEDELDAISQGSQGLNQSEPADTGYQVSSASVAPVRAPKRSKTESLADETIERHQYISEVEFEDTEPKAGRRVPAKRKVATKNSTLPEDIPNQNLERSMVSVEIRVDDSGNEADAGISDKPVKKGGKKKAPARKAKKPTTEQATAKQTKRLPLMEVSEQSDPEYGGPNENQTRGNRTVTKPAEVEGEDGDDYQENIAERQSALGMEGASEAFKTHEDGDSNTPLRDPSHANRKQKHIVQISEPSVINISSPAPPTPMQKHTPSPSPQSSDAENQPPSTRPSANRPPVLSPTKKVNITVPLAASTPSASPSKRNTGRVLNTAYPWSPTDIDEMIFAGSLGTENIDLNSVLNEAKGGLDSPQKKMTVEEWVLWNSKNGEEKLKRECERLVGIFEKEGGRAMMALEGIECLE